MDSATISALAALGGAVIGGLTSFTTSWLTQQTQARGQQLIHKITRQEELYKNFIDEASRLYVDSLVHDSPSKSRVLSMSVLNSE